MSRDHIRSLENDLYVTLLEKLLRARVFLSHMFITLTPLLVRSGFTRTHTLAVPLMASIPLAECCPHSTLVTSSQA